MTKAKKLPSGSWRAFGQYYDETGKRHRKSFTEKTEAKANYAAEQFEEKKRFLSVIDNISVGEAIDKYISKKEPFLSPSTITGYKRYRKNYFQRLMPIKLGRLTNKHIQDVINDDFLRCNAKTIKNAHGLLTAALNEYYPDFKVKIILPKRHKKIFPIPNNEELKIILEAVEGDLAEIPILFAIYLGLRMSEVRGLDYSDIKDGKITIHNSIIDIEEGTFEKDYLKTPSSTRIVRLPGILLKKLEIEGSGKIVKYSANTIRKHFKKILLKNNLIEYRFHDLRHVNASVMLRLGVPDKYAMEKGGWSTDSTLKTVYQHTMADYHEELDKLIYEYIDNI